MTDFHSFEGLRSAVADRSFDRPPVIVSNAHVTGLGVTRALKRAGIPVIAIDRNGRGVAPYSTAVDLAGRVTYPLDDEDGFREDVEALAAAVDHDPVAFACMDEWVHAFGRTRPEGVTLSWDPDSAGRVLDKYRLYGIAERLGVPYPETYRLDSAEGEAARLTHLDPGEAADRLGFPLVVKPALKRRFEELVGTNVVEVADREEYRDLIDRAREAGVRVMAQEKVPVETGEDRSLASYVPPEGDPLAVVGNARVRYPPGYGTSCVVDRVEDPEIRRRALSVLDDAGYHGISEAEFVRDADRDTHVLLDVNTRPWKWIGMPVATGANLPLAAYRDTTDADLPRPTVTDPAAGERWVSLADYLSLLGGEDRVADVLSRSEWEAFLSGSFEDDDGLAAAVYAPLLTPPLGVAPVDPAPRRRSC
ncbi:carboxylate--amine ligase [Halobacteriales archaeon QS_8_69_26]|nr:MAG: carboxylate--amine ligase [Halobacteriales archaeon QS_8_69_26]